MARDGSWASARDVMENILPNMYMKRAARIAAQARAAGVAAAAGPAALPLSYEVADVRAAFENILGDRVLQIDNLDTLMAAVNASRDAAAAAGEGPADDEPADPSRSGTPPAGGEAAPVDPSARKKSESGARTSFRVASAAAT